MTERLLTAEQVADKLQVHHLTVLKWIKSKKLKAAKLGRIYRINPTSLDEFIENSSA